MKKILIMVVLLMGIFASVFGLAGCSGKAHSEENKVKFSKFSQQERIDYVRKYLSDKYGYDCEITEVNRKQVNMFKTEDCFFASTVMNGNVISIWITDDGSITDDVYLLDMSDELSAFFKAKVEQVIPVCKVFVRTTMNSLPDNTAITKESIDSYLKNEPALSYVRIFVNKDTGFLQKGLDNLSRLLKDYEVDLFVYLCDDIEKIEIGSYDLSAFDYSARIKKG